MNVIERIERGRYLLMVHGYPHKGCIGRSPTAILHENELLRLAKIGQATKRYMAGFAKSIRDGDDNIGEFHPCMSLDYQEADCEGCKLYEICELMKEEHDANS